MRKIWFRLMLLCAMGFIASVSIEESSKWDVIRVADWVMTPDEAHRYLVETISPILVKYAQDQAEIPALQSRLYKLATMNNSGEIEYQGMPAYYPGKKGRIAKIDFNLATDKPILMVFVPAVQGVQKEMRREGRPQRDFEDAVAIYYAHEMLHLELEGIDSIRKRVNKRDRDTIVAAEHDEAVVWCKTIIELIRPMAKQGRRPLDFMLVNSTELLKVNDDCNHPAWVRAFRNY